MACALGGIVTAIIQYQIRQTISNPQAKQWLPGHTFRQQPQVGTGMNTPLSRWVIGFVLATAPLLIGQAQMTTGEAPMEDSAVTMADRGGVQPGERFEWQGQLETGQRVAVRNVNGPIHVWPAASFEALATGELRIEAVKTSRRSPLDSVQIEVDVEADVVTVCARTIGAFGSRKTGCRGSLRPVTSGPNDVQVAFDLYVPVGHAVVATTVNGEVHVQRIEAAVTATTTNGSVRIEGSREAIGESANGSLDATLSHLDATLRLKTVNGSLRVEVERAGWRGTADLATVNGAIYVTLPRDASVDLSARTRNGGVRSELPVTVTGAISRNTLEGRIGEGGATLKLRAVNGRLELHAR